jgi:Domain of unknown function (DUF5110)
VYAGADGGFDLYEDPGVGFGYRDGQFTRTAMRWGEAAGRSTLTIAKPRGSYPGDPATRHYSVRVLGVDRPSAVTISSGNRRRTAQRVSYDGGARLLTIDTPTLATTRPAFVSLAFGRGQAATR